MLKNSLCKTHARAHETVFSEMWVLTCYTGVGGRVQMACGHHFLEEEGSIGEAEKKCGGRGKKREKLREKRKAPDC